MIKDVIVVAIWNNGEKRYQEYFPQKPFFMIDANERNRLMKLAGENNRLMPKEGPLSDAYLKFIVAELNPFIDSSYSVHTDMKNTIIAGSSMGGLISLYAICEYPEIFGGAICMSTHWPGIFSANEIIPAAFYTYLKNNIPDAKTHKLYFDYGTETLDTLYEPYQLEVNVILKQKNYVELKNLLIKKFEEADHSEKAWADRVYMPVVFMLKKN
jgi:predicted alpha/beta superfamily hydrolase